MTDFYEIRVAGHLNPNWFAWFADLELTYPVADETLLCGTLPDQAALHGLLERIRDLNLTLLSVSRCDPADIAVAKRSNSCRK